MEPAIAPVRLALFLDVHAPVGLRQEFFGIEPVGRIDRLSDAERENVFPADFSSGSYCQIPKMQRLGARRFLRQTGRNHYEFIAAHSRHVVVFTTGLL